MSTARSITLYIEPNTLKRLRLAIRLYHANGIGRVLPAGVMPAAPITVDELANDLLNEVINDKYSLVKGLEKALIQTETEYIKEHKTTCEQQ